MKGLESVAAPMTGDVVSNLGHCPCVAPLFILSLAENKQWILAVVDFWNLIRHLLDGYERKASFCHFVEFGAVVLLEIQ